VRCALRQVESIGRRRYRYLAVPKDERERPHLVRERVKCGKSTCACARDRALRHGPYTYFWWERWDTASGRVVYYREYVPRSELVRVRRWIRRYRAEVAKSRGLLTALRRLFASEERRERQRVRVRIIYRPVETA
jgi:hypothetical protein